MSDIDHGRFAFDASLDDRSDSEISQNFSKRAYAVPNYLSEENLAFNDLDITVNRKIEEKLCDGGVDEGIAKHFAHKFSFRKLGPAKFIENVRIYTEYTISENTSIWPFRDAIL